MIHGSLTAGTLSASEPRYATKVEFDNRLTTMRAPSFPLSDRYELDLTSGEWRVAAERPTGRAGRRGTSSWTVAICTGSPC